METIRAGIMEPSNGLSSHKIQKSLDGVSITSSIVSNGTSPHSEKTVSLEEDATSVSVSATTISQPNTTCTIQNTRVVDISQTIRGHICKLGDYSETFFKAIDLQSYLEYISDERLIHMPRRGSNWDRVLRAAQCFGVQLWAFGRDVGRFCPDTEVASITALGSIQILLEVSSHIVYGRGKSSHMTPD